MARLICIGLLLTLMAFLPGCGGCRHAPPKTPEELEKEEIARKKEEEERLKPDFQAKFLVSHPPTERPTVGCFAKPGHWTCVALEDVTANHFDFVGEFEVSSTDREGSPLPIGDTPFELAICRDMALPKKQTKSLESLLFIPPGSRTASTAYYFNAGQGGRRVVEFPREHLMGVMPSWQYHFVVLARMPEAYQYILKLPSIRPPSNLDNTAAPYYRVALLGTDRRPALPSHANQWTSIACVLWDDASPSALEPAQQQAMLDWLHWGGQLILSGPETLDTLRNSFLAPYLPALSAGVRKLGPAELGKLNAFSRQTLRPLAPPREWSGIRLQKHADAEFVPKTGELLAERRVGRGRVVVSAFRLSERDFSDWPGRDEIFSAMLLRHPPRQYVIGSDAQTLLEWTDKVDRLDAGRISGLRYFARDAGVPFSSYGADKINDNLDPPQRNGYYRSGNGYYPRSGRYEAEIDPVPATGVAAWNDFNEVANSARKTLQSAARIEIPNRKFVIWVLAVYLIVLVPVNWLLFRGLGRVEWAWVAAPIIAIVCTGTVIRLAQLDIGFARLQTEVAVAEIQGDYPRAHVTRYNALYTSLTTYYNLQSNDPGAAMLPFPAIGEKGKFALPFGQQLHKLTCRRGEQVTLSGFPVNSNSTGLVHSEEMLDVGGGVSLEKEGDHTWKLVNRSKLNLHGVGLLQKTPFGVEEAWIGEVPSGKTTSGFEWNAIADGDDQKTLWASQREQSPISASNARSGALSLHDLLAVGQGAANLDAGEVRLIGWSSDDLPGLSIKPAAPQTRRGIVVIAHLGYGLGDPPIPDKKEAKE